MSKLSSCKTIVFLCAFCVVEPIGSSAQTFKTLHSFNGYPTDGANLNAALVQGTDGNFYATTDVGGTKNCAPYSYFGCGTVFKINPKGAVTILHSFDGIDGSEPDSGLVLATDGNFYGTTIFGGASSNCTNGCGTVFKITPKGVLTTMHSFDGADGFAPSGGALVQGTDGNFYGTTHGGNNGDGTVFKITPKGVLTTMHSFDGADGSNPIGGLVQGTDGNFYGTTEFGGASNKCDPSCGTVFKITPGGKLTTLHSFCPQTGCTDGFYPIAGLVQGTDGNFYGTTSRGGNNEVGTVFKITPAGALTTLHSFDGGSPFRRLVQATDGNFYGTTVFGGASSNCTNGCGTVFKINPVGALTTLHSFDGTDGSGPVAGPVQATDGNFYGTTSAGGVNTTACNGSGCGTVFSLSVGLGPFVETVPTSGAVGTAVIVLGNNLTGATKVTFNGTAATFTVVSSTEIKTTVPNGATTGKVKVTTPHGTLSSNVIFRVTPTISSFLPTTGSVGTTVVITGESFTGTTSVTFGGVKATSFTVDTYTKITAIVPSAAKTGKIAVTTAGGTATSAGTFTVY